MSASLRNALQAVAPNAQVTSTSSAAAAAAAAAKRMEAHKRLWSDIVRSQLRTSNSNNNGRAASNPSKHQPPQNDIENEGPSHQEEDFSTPTKQQTSGLVIVPAAAYAAAAASQTPRTEPRRSSPIQRSVSFSSVQQRPYISNSHGGGFEETYMRLSREAEELADTVPRIPDVGLNEIQAFHHFTLYPFRLSFRPGERMPLRYGRDLRTVVAKHFSVREQDLYLEVIHTHHRQALLDNELLHDLKANRPQLQVTFLIQPVLVKDHSDSPCPRCVEISRRLRVEAELDRCPDPVREEELRQHCAAHPIDWYPQARPYEGRSDPRGAMGFNEHCIVPTKPHEDGRARFRRDPYNCANFVSRSQDGVWTATPWPTPNLVMLPLPVVTTAADSTNDAPAAALPHAPAAASSYAPAAALPHAPAAASSYAPAAALPPNLAMLPRAMVTTAADYGSNDAPAAALQSTTDSDADDGDSGDSVPQQPRAEDAPLEAGPAAAVLESFSEACLSSPSSSSAATAATPSSVEDEPLPPNGQAAPADPTAVEDADVADEEPARPSTEASMSDGQTETLAAQSVRLSEDEVEEDGDFSEPEHPDALSTASTTTPSRTPPPRQLLSPATAAALRDVEVALDAANGRTTQKRSSTERESSSRARPTAKAKGGKGLKQTARPHEPKANSAPQRQSGAKAKPTAPVASKSKSKLAMKKKRTVDPDEAILRAVEQQRAAAERASKVRTVPQREPRRVEQDFSDVESRDFTELKIEQITVVFGLKDEDQCSDQKITDEDVRHLRAATARNEETMPMGEEEEVDYGEAANDEIKRVRELSGRINRHAKWAHLVNKDQALNLCREALARERSFIQRTGTPTTAVPPFHILNFCCKLTSLTMAVRGFAPSMSQRPAVRLPLDDAKIAIELRAVYLRTADDHHHPELTFSHTLTLYSVGLATMLFQMRVAVTNRLDFPEQFWNEASDRVDACALRTIVPQMVPQRVPKFLSIQAIHPVTEVMGAMLWDALVLNGDLESCLFRMAGWHDPITELANFLHLDSVLVIMAPILTAICEGLVYLDADEVKGVLFEVCRGYATNHPCNPTTLTVLRLQQRRNDVRRFMRPTLHAIQLWNALYLAWQDAHQQMQVAKAARASA